MKLKNCCYINSTLQLLASAPDLINFCKLSTYFAARHVQSEYGLNMEFVREFCDIMAKLRSYSFEFFDPSRFYTLLQLMLEGFELQAKQDCSEFLSLLFDRLRTSFRLTGYFDIVQSCFEGGYSTLTHCSRCDWQSRSDIVFECFAVTVPDARTAASYMSLANSSMSSEDKAAYTAKDSGFWSMIKKYVTDRTALGSHHRTITLQDCLFSFFNPVRQDYL
jgi:ubiquitin C-terminal hydrolase